jgi:hypothetical protein
MKIQKSCRETQIMQNEQNTVMIRKKIKKYFFNKIYNHFLFYKNRCNCNQ